MYERNRENKRAKSISSSRSGVKVNDSVKRNHGSAIEKNNELVKREEKHDS